jgi:hypothetical protein
MSGVGPAGGTGTTWLTVIGSLRLGHLSSRLAVSLGAAAGTLAGKRYPGQLADQPGGSFAAGGVGTTVPAHTRWVNAAAHWIDPAGFAAGQHRLLRNRRLRIGRSVTVHATAWVAWTDGLTLPSPAYHQG